MSKVVAEWLLLVISFLVVCISIFVLAKMSGKSQQEAMAEAKAYAIPKNVSDFFGKLVVIFVVWLIFFTIYDSFFTA